MPDTQISISELIQLSKSLEDQFFPNPTIYSLLMLSLVTIYTYSRKREKKIGRLSSHARIDLAITFLPDLIRSLIEDKVLTEAMAMELRNECKRRRDDLQAILVSYVCVAGGLRIKMELKDENKSSCIIV